ncbi:MAG TPA: 30S ribosomal protein S1, partial [bacterium]|nr:30S ribosomal protein S1 [bacterium]
KVYIDEVEDDHGHVVLSKERADAFEAWRQVEEVHEKDGIIDGLVVNKVKGGLSVNLGGIKAFLPGSQIDLKPVKSLDKLIGHKYQFKILKLNKSKGNIVLSRRAILEVERETMRRDILENIKEGQIIRGVVKNITDLTWGRVSHPKEVLKVNEEIDVVVLKYDPKTEKVSLGLKQLQEDPWTKVGNYEPGQRIKGRVVSITDYGVFVEIEAGIEGLVHVSELTWSKKVKHPSKVVKVDDEVEAVILDVDIDNKKIALGLKQLEPNPWDILHQKYPLGSKVTGKIRNITDFGMFVGIENEDIDALIHVSDISWDKNLKWPSDDYKKGQDLEALVLNIDKDNHKFALGLKQLSDDPYAVLMRAYPLGAEVTGIVESVSEKGIVLRLNEQTTALLPSAETGVGRVELKDKFKEGQEVVAQVKKYEDRDRKMIVSVKMLTRRQEKENMSEFLNKQGDASVTFKDIMEKSQKVTNS